MLIEERQVALNDLIMACLEAADGYRDSEALFDDVDLSALFEHLSKVHGEMGDALGEYVRALGGLPREPDTEVEQAHWLTSRFMASLAANETLAIVEERLQAEAHIAALIETAQGYELPEDAAQYLARARTSVDEASSRLQAIKNRL